MHVGIQRSQLLEIVRSVGKHPGRRGASARFRLLAGIGGLTCAGVGRRADEHREIVEVEMFGDEFGAGVDPFAAADDSQVAAQIAVADRALEVAIMDEPSAAA